MNFLTSVKTFSTQLGLNGTIFPLHAEAPSVTVMSLATAPPSFPRRLQRSLSAALLLALIGMGGQAAASQQAQFDAIKRLGDLNGVALHCRALLETRRMKMALIRNLPQRRQLGELFDRQSHESFMAFIENKGRCPSMAELGAQVDTAIKQLERVYAK